MAMMIELHNQGQEGIPYSCNNCKTPMETRYRCIVCGDCDLCVACHEKDGLVHRMENLGFDMDEDTSSDHEQSNPQESRRVSMKRHMHFLAHARQCHNANCRRRNCHYMKRIFEHTRSCTPIANTSCLICKNVTSHCCYNEKHCEETKCPVPFCLRMRQRLHRQQQQARVRRQQQQMLNRCISSICMMRNLLVASQNTPEQMPSQPAPVQSTSVQALQDTWEMGPPQGIPGLQQRLNRTEQALRQFMQALKNPSVHQKQQQVLRILKSSPQFMAAFFKQRLLSQEQQQQQTGIAGGMLLEMQSGGMPGNINVVRLGMQSGMSTAQLGGMQQNPFSITHQH